MLRRAGNGELPRLQPLVFLALYHAVVSIAALLAPVLGSLDSVRGIPNGPDAANIRGLAVAYIFSAIAILAGFGGNDSKGLRFLAIYGAIAQFFVGTTTALVSANILPSVPVTFGFRIMPSTMLMISYIGVIQDASHLVFLFTITANFLISCMLTGLLWNVEAFSSPTRYIPNPPRFMVALRNGEVLGPPDSPLAILLLWVLPLISGLGFALGLQVQLSQAQRKFREDPRAVRLLWFARVLLLVGYCGITCAVILSLTGGAPTGWTDLLSNAYEVTALAICPLVLLHAISVRFDQLDKQILAVARAEEREQTVKGVLRMCFHDLRNPMGCLTLGIDELESLLFTSSANNTTGPFLLSSAAAAANENNGANTTVSVAVPPPGLVFPVTASSRSSSKVSGGSSQEELLVGCGGSSDWKTLSHGQQQEDLVLVSRQQPYLPAELQLTVKETLRIMQTSGQQIQRLLDTVLDMQKLDSGTLNIELIPMSIQRLSDDAITQLTPRMKAKPEVKASLGIGPAIPGLLLGDHFRVLQCLSNLLANAHRHARKKVKLRVKIVSVSEDKPDDLRQRATALIENQRAQALGQEQEDKKSRRKRRAARKEQEEEAARQGAPKPRGCSALLHSFQSTFAMIAGNGNGNAGEDESDDESLSVPSSGGGSGTSSISSTSHSSSASSPSWLHRMHQWLCCGCGSRRQPGASLVPPPPHLASPSAAASPASSRYQSVSTGAAITALDFGSGGDGSSVFGGSGGSSVITESPLRFGGARQTSAATTVAPDPDFPLPLETVLPFIPAPQTTYSVRLDDLSNISKADALSSHHNAATDATSFMSSPSSPAGAFAKQSSELRRPSSSSIGSVELFQHAGATSNNNMGSNNNSNGSNANGNGNLTISSPATHQINPLAVATFSAPPTPLAPETHNEASATTATATAAVQGGLAVSNLCVRVRFSVTDDGEGIPESQLANLWKAFSQLKSSSSSSSSASTSFPSSYGKGYGLGLMIVRRLVEKMGGQVGCSSVVGQGSTFWIELPFRVLANRSSQTAGTTMNPTPSGSETPRAAAGAAAATTTTVVDGPQGGGSAHAVVDASVITFATPLPQEKKSSGRLGRLSTLSVESSDSTASGSSSSASSSSAAHYSGGPPPQGYSYFYRLRPAADTHETGLTPVAAAPTAAGTGAFLDTSNTSSNSNAAGSGGNLGSSVAKAATTTTTTSSASVLRGGSLRKSSSHSRSRSHPTSRSSSSSSTEDESAREERMAHLKGGKGGLLPGRVAVAVSSSGDEFPEPVASLPISGKLSPGRSTSSARRKKRRESPRRSSSGRYHSASSHSSSSSSSSSSSAQQQQGSYAVTVAVGEDAATTILTSSSSPGSNSESNSAPSDAPSDPPMVFRESRSGVSSTTASATPTAALAAAAVMGAPIIVVCSPSQPFPSPGPQASPSSSTQWQQHHSQQQPSSGPVPLILFADDEPSNRLMLGRLLRRRLPGVVVEELESGEELIARYQAVMGEQDEAEKEGLEKRHLLVAVISDFTMGGITGGQAATALRSDSDHPFKGFFVGVTGNALAEDARRFQSEGADLVMAKPIDISLLVREIQAEMNTMTTTMTTTSNTTTALAMTPTGTGAGGAGLTIMTQPSFSSSSPSPPS
jgi:signal transduction histidine kinase/CheY-like chemotaxis protein